MCVFSLLKKFQSLKTRKHTHTREHKWTLRIHEFQNRNEHRTHKLWNIGLFTVFFLCVHSAKAKWTARSWSVWYLVSSRNERWRRADSAQKQECVVRSVAVVRLLYIPNPTYSGLCTESITTKKCSNGRIVLHNFLYSITDNTPFSI